MAMLASLTGGATFQGCKKGGLDGKDMNEAGYRRVIALTALTQLIISVALPSICWRLRRWSPWFS